jgi:hypothetical protein
MKLDLNLFLIMRSALEQEEPQYLASATTPVIPQARYCLKLANERRQSLLQQPFKRGKKYFKSNKCYLKSTTKWAVCLRCKLTGKQRVALSKILKNMDLQRRRGLVRASRKAISSYSRDSGCRLKPLSPEAFFSQYLRTHASQLFPAAGSRPVKASAAISAYAIFCF